MCIYTSNGLAQSLDLRGTEYCACSNVRRAARAVTQLFDAELKPTGIRSTQFVLLVAIAELAPISLGRLAQILVIDRTTLSRSLRLMEKHDLVALAVRSTMRRRFVTLLPKGRNVLARSMPFWTDAQRRFVEKVGDQYWRAMQKELDKLPSVALDLERTVRERTQRFDGATEE